MGMFGSSSIEGWLQLQLSNQVDISLLNVWNKTEKKTSLSVFTTPFPPPQKMRHDVNFQERSAIRSNDNDN